MRRVKDIRLQQYKTFVSERVSSQEETFTAPIHRTSLNLFKAYFSEPRQKSGISVIKDQQAKNTDIFLAAHSGQRINGVIAHENTS
jgi:hypothetical protein